MSPYWDQIFDNKIDTTWQKIHKTRILTTKQNNMIYYSRQVKYTVVIIKFQKSIPILMQYIHKGSIIYSKCPSVILEIDSKLNEGCLERWIIDNQNVSMESKKLQ